MVFVYQYEKRVTIISVQLQELLQESRKLIRNSGTLPVCLAQVYLFNNAVTYVLKQKIIRRHSADRRLAFLAFSVSFYLCLLSNIYKHQS